MCTQIITSALSNSGVASVVPFASPPRDENYNDAFRRYEQNVTAVNNDGAGSPGEMRRGKGVYYYFFRIFSFLFRRHRRPSRNVLMAFSSVFFISLQPSFFTRRGRESNPAVVLFLCPPVFDIFSPLSHAHSIVYTRTNTDNYYGFASFPTENHRAGTQSALRVPNKR